MARIAGIKLAKRATKPGSSGTPTKVSGSVASIPYTRLPNIQLIPNAASCPNTVPMNISRMLSPEGCFGAKGDDRSRKGPSVSSSHPTTRASAVRERWRAQGGQSTRLVLGSKPDQARRTRTDATAASRPRPVSHLSEDRNSIRAHADTGNREQSHSLEPTQVFTARHSFSYKCEDSDLEPYAPSWPRGFEHR
jgi:hypothetical protein